MIKNEDKRKFLLFVVLIAVVSSLSTAYVVSKLYPVVEKKKTSSTKLVDDFSTGDEINLVGGKRSASVSGGSKLNTEILRFEEPYEANDVLEVRYHLLDSAEANLTTDLNGLDVSQATKLQLWVRSSNERLPKFEAHIEDIFGAKASHAFKVKPNTKWQKVEIPLGHFEGINFNGLRRLTLSFRVDETGANLFYLDDIAFSGPPEMFFLSIQDNLIGFPEGVLSSTKHLQTLSDKKLLQKVAADTWKHFENLVDRRSHLPVNYIQTAPEPIIGDYTSTTDIAMYLMGIVSAHDLDFIDRRQAVDRVRSTLKQLHRLNRWEGSFYNYYSTTNLQVTHWYVSSVDNAWLVAGLVVVRQAFPEVEALATSLIEGMDLSLFYDDANGQMLLGYTVDEETLQGKTEPYHYGLLVSEARIISMMAIGKGDVPEEHWFRVYRTLPENWDWQKQKPQGRYSSYLGHDVFQGHYSYELEGETVRLVPSWGGSLFEFLMPTLLMDEAKFAKTGLGRNNRIAVQLHKDYALNHKGYPVWGISPSATPQQRYGGYTELGVPGLGAKGYPDKGIITPHVSFLALMYDAESALNNIRQLLQFDLYGPYGFYDAVDVETGHVANRYLALDQGMVLVSINNYLNQGAIYKHVEEDPVIERLKPLLKEESFY